MISYLKITCWIGVILIGGLTSCKKDVPETPATEPLSIVPEIRNVDVNPTTVTEFRDSILFFITFYDGDGDVGFESADSVALTLEDTRTSLVQEYHVPPQAYPGDSVAVKGTLRVKLNYTILFDDSTGETTTYKVQLKDRAGNRSNAFETEEITILPE